MEHYYQTLFAYVEAVIPLPDADKTSIRQSFQPFCFPKGTIIEKAGTVPEYHNFVVSGFMRNYHLNEENEEITVDINDGPRFFTSYFHFMHRTVSNENIQCITDCEILRIHRDTVDATAAVSQTQKDFTVQILQHHLEQDKQRILDLTKLTAEQRYQKFAAAHPNVLQNVPLAVIASYLGITQRHLSRLRKIA
jgi:CRP-like cAMP-binding protein